MLAKVHNIVTLILVSFSFSTCADDDSNDKGSQDDRDRFYFSQTNDEDWINIHVYGYRFEYPRGELSRSRSPELLQRNPISITPAIDGFGRENQYVELTMIISDQYSMDQCDSFLERGNPYGGLKSAKPKWATLIEENEENSKGFYVSKIHIVYDDPSGSCIKVFFYDTSQSGLQFPVSLEDDNELSRKLRRILATFYKT